MNKTLHSVFVYGTLRTNTKSTHVLAGYSLYDVGPFPCVTPDTEGKVFGNIINVNNRELASLDRCEGIARGLYTREKVQVLPEEDVTCFTSCWVYVAGKELQEEVMTLKKVPSGDWFDHPTKQKSIFSPYKG